MILSSKVTCELCLQSGLNQQLSVRRSLLLCKSMVDCRLMDHIVCPFLCMLPATPYPVSSAHVCFYGEAFPDGPMILHLLGAAFRAWQHYFTLTVSGKTPGAARMRDQSPMLGVGGDMQSEVSAANCPIWVAVNMAPFGLLQITHYSSVCGAS